MCDGYFLPKYINITDSITYCSTQCGDGLKRLFEECDDGNQVNGDGCSSNCTVEKAWTCSFEFTHTCCTLQNSEIYLSIQKIVKVPSQNKITLQFQIQPSLPSLTNTVLHKNVKLKVTGVPLFNESRIVLQGQIIEVTYDFTETIHGMKGHIAFEL